MRQSGGHAKVYSEPGQGTSVKLYLPRFYGGGEAAPVAQGEATPSLPMGSRRDVVLVVEDEDALRLISVEALRELGYTVRHAESGAAALRGRPELKVLYTTGFTRNAVVHNGVLDPDTNFLPKPFTLERLAAKVREVLGHAPSNLDARTHRSRS